MRQHSQDFRQYLLSSRDSSFYNGRTCGDNLDNQEQGHDRSVGVKVM